MPTVKNVQTKLNISILILVIILTVALRIWVIAEKYTFTHDGGISYLSATCHQGDYATNKFEVSLKPASHWKDYLRMIEQPFCFEQIKKDLAQYDIHPPLYFWLLHLWSLIYGVNLWTGPLLNTIIATLTVLFLVRLSCDILDDWAEINLVTFTYALNPAIILISVEARQYDLLALWALLLVWQVIRFAYLRKQHLRILISITIFTFMGALTHYFFILIVMVCIIFLTMKLLNREKRELSVALIAMSLGYLGAFLFHPYIFFSFARRRAEWSQFSVENLVMRLEKVALSFYGYYYIIILLLLMLGWALVLFYKQRSRLYQYIHNVDRTGFYILFFFFGVTGITIALYMLFLTPQHAMEPKYLSMAWPFFAFIPVFILRFFPRFRIILTAFFYITPLLFALLTPLLRGLTIQMLHNPSSLLRNADLVVIDNPARGILPGLIWHIPDETLVVVSTQEHLIQHSELWLGNLTDNSIYISEISYGNTDKEQKKIIRFINRTGYETIPVRGGIWGLGTVFKIKQK